MIYHTWAPQEEVLSRKAPKKNSWKNRPYLLCLFHPVKNTKYASFPQKPPSSQQIPKNRNFSTAFSSTQIHIPDSIHFQSAPNTELLSSSCQGGQGARRASYGVLRPCSSMLRCATTLLRHTIREQGSKGAREQRSTGAREQGSKGAREQGSKGAREQAQLAPEKMNLYQLNSHAPTLLQKQITHEVPAEPILVQFQVFNREKISSSRKSL